MSKKDKNRIEPMCFNCEHAVRLEGSDMCVCSKKGMMKADDRCSSFKADLLKYVPSRPRMPELK